jgi:hypothetical protein
MYQCKQTTTLYIKTKIEERERIDEGEEKNEKEKGSGRHVSPLPNSQVGNRNDKDRGTHSFFFSDITEVT